MATVRHTLGSFKVNKKDLGDVYTKAEEYEKRLYKYYTGEEPSVKWWKTDLQEILQTNKYKGKRYVPGRSVNVSQFNSDELIDVVTDHIYSLFEKYPATFEESVFNSLDELQERINMVKSSEKNGGIEGLDILKKYINRGYFKPNKPFTEKQLNGLKIELVKTIEKAFTLKPGEVIVNTHNYSDGSPVFDIEITGEDGTKIMSEVKSNTKNFNILSLYDSIKAHKQFLSELVEGCSIDKERKKIILSKNSVKNASINLLKEHFKDVQPFFESAEYPPELFTKLFEDFLLTAQDEEENDSTSSKYQEGTLESKEAGELDTSKNSQEGERRAANWLARKMTGYLLNYGKGF